MQTINLPWHSRCPRLFVSRSAELTEPLLADPVGGSARIDNDIEAALPPWAEALPCQTITAVPFHAVVVPPSPSDCDSVARSEAPPPSEYRPTPMSHRGALIGGGVGAFVGAVFGLQYADAFSGTAMRLGGSLGSGDPVWWPYCVYIPLFSVSTAVTGAAIAQLIDGASLHSQTALFSFGMRLPEANDVAGRALLRQLSRREAAALVVGVIWGIWLGCDYASMLGGGWPYRVFPVVLALNQPLSVLAWMQWWVMPPVRSAFQLRR